MKDCNIVKDLLPLYIEELCSEDTREYVEKHLESCDECKESFDYLKYSELCVGAVERKEINAFKKLERYISGKILIGYFLFLAAMVVGTMVLMGMTFYTSAETYHVLMPAIMIATGATFRNVSVSNIKENRKKWYPVGQIVLLAGSSLVLLYTMIAVNKGWTTFGIPLYELGPVVDKVLKGIVTISMVLLITHLYQVGRKQVRYSLWSNLSILCMFLSLLYDSFLHNMSSPEMAINYLVKNTVMMYAVFAIVLFGMWVWERKIATKSLSS